MNPQKLHRLGALQLEILQILWDRQEATVGEVHQILHSTSGLAYTTVATMLRKMEERGLVRHRSEGRTFVYHARVAEAAVTHRMTNDLLDRLFGGNLADMVSHLLTTREVSPDELKQLEKLIADRRKGE